VIAQIANLYQHLNRRCRGCSSPNSQHVNITF